MLNYSDYLQRIFPGIKVQKLSLNSGMSCPNRDGTLGTGGCIYCRNDSFTPDYCLKDSSIKKQIEEGKRFFSRKYPAMKFLAYFQSYTSTHSSSLSELEEIYETALSDSEIVGLIVGSRPDTLNDSIIELLVKIKVKKPVFIELGAETSHDNTLQLINRHHTWQDVENAVRRCEEHDIPCGLHLICGLPGESEEMMLETVRRSVSLPIYMLKFHQLQILKNTKLEKMYNENPGFVKPFELDDYLELCKKILKLLPEEIVVERFISQSPPGLVVAPKWGLKNYQFMHRLQNMLKG